MFWGSLKIFFNFPLPLGEFSTFDISLTSFVLFLFREEFLWDYATGILLVFV